MDGQAKDTVLKSNAAADEGPGFKKIEKISQVSTRLGSKTKDYDLGDPQARQSLRNLLISVY